VSGDNVRAPLISIIDQWRALSVIQKLAVLVAAM